MTQEGRGSCSKGSRPSLSLLPALGREADIYRVPYGDTLASKPACHIPWLRASELKYSYAGVRAVITAIKPMESAPGLQNN